MATCELTVNALAALVRRGWRITMDSTGVWYEFGVDGHEIPGDWIEIPAQVAAELCGD